MIESGILFSVEGLLSPTPGIILSGSPFSVYDPSAPHVDPDVFTLGVPVLGICYGLQEIARTHGGQVEAHTHRERSTPFEGGQM